LSRYPGKTNAPEIPPGLDWINTDAPIQLKDLRGKIVLLDFWTYCCINCMHIIPDLKKLEEKYAAEIVVIGVHSAKFQNEKNTASVIQAVMRYEIEHPVVNDSAMIVWQQYGIRAWPTVVVIDPLGKVIGAAAGEGVFQSLDPILSSMVREFDATGQLDRRKYAMDPIARRMPQPVLSFPGKVLADAPSNRLFIADSNHNRIVICDLSGAVEDCAGTGTIGSEDGSFDTAAFHHPQGMCVAGSSLYVADTENHTIRILDLPTRQVKTLQFDGVKLNSPWDLVALGDAIYIAMAGSHQIWKLNPATGVIGPFAGSGKEALIDGPLMEAALAQPSGITTDGERLYVADSETSSIRSISVGSGGEVQTFVGMGLFEFGDVDGPGDEARMQHPLGVVYCQGMLYVADTYNGKVRKVNPITREVSSQAGGFEEPGGISAAGSKLYVADTNSHTIKIIDIQTNAIDSLMLSSLEKLRTAGGAWSGDTIQAKQPVAIRPGKTAIVFDVLLPEDYKTLPESPTRLLFSVNDGESRQLVDRPSSFPVEWDVDITENTTLNVMVQLYYCHARDNALCFFKESLFTIPVEVSAASENRQIGIVHNPLSVG
jgi:DNA-binding beta-propeller fold protein YncE